MSKPRVLFCIACGKNHGIGHLRRSFALIEEGRALFDSRVCVMRGDAKEQIAEKGLSGNHSFIDSVEDAGATDLIVSDMRDTEAHEMIRLNQLAPVLSIDDRGAGAKYSYLTIYSLPTVENFQGNFNGPSYIVLSTAIKKVASHRVTRRKSILVSFGGADPYNLSEYITVALNTLGIQPVVVRGPFFRHNLIHGDSEIVDNPRNIYDLISSARVLITSFGITMYEAFYLKTPVILFNHSKYHWQLANKVPVLNLGYYNAPDDGDIIEKLGGALGDKQKLMLSADRNSSLIDGHGGRRIISIIEKALNAHRRECLFNHRRYEVIRRDRDYSLMRCRRCRDLFLFELEGNGKRYSGKEYFLSEYKKQYGRSYIDDKEKILRLGKKRIAIIERIVKNRRGQILDIGCALGFFLELARGRGWSTTGIEISPFAAEWARTHLSLDIITGSFLDMGFETETFDVVTLFFVAEHFRNVEKVIKKVYEILKKNGLIVLALPNRGGISYFVNPHGYSDKHPRDHYFDTSVRNLKRFLKDYGFKKRKVVATGIHPERFLNRIGIKRKWFLLYPVYTYIAKILKIGDTFEYYGIKT